MGMYDVYGDGIQVKINPQGLNYEVGDKLSLADGIYIGYEGIIVVEHGEFIALFGYNELFDKWGNRLSCKDILDSNNPVSQAVEKIPSDNTISSEDRFVYVGNGYPKYRRYLCSIASIKGESGKLISVGILFDDGFGMIDVGFDDIRKLEK